MSYRDPLEAKAYARRHYQKHKALYKARSKENNKRSRKIAREFINIYKAGLGCASVAQLVEALPSKSSKWEFESLPAHQLIAADALGRSRSRSVLSTRHLVKPSGGAATNGVPAVAKSHVCAARQSDEALRSWSPFGPLEWGIHSKPGT